MPIYEYRCESCDKIFEKIIFRKDEKISCPECGNANVQRVLSVCGFKTGGDKGAASSRMSGSAGSSCAGCTATSCKSCTG